jgi:hypothetical protein
LFGEQPGDLSNAVIINQPLAEELGAFEGDLVEVRLEQPRAIPTDSLLGRPVDDEGLRIEPTRVSRILPPAGVGRFSLSVQQQQPMTLFVELRRLQRRLAADGRQPPDAVNVLLIAAQPGAATPTSAEHLQANLRQAIRLEDMGLTLRQGPDSPRYTGPKHYLSLESRRMLVEPGVVDALRAYEKQTGWQVTPTLTYLANLMTSLGERVRELSLDLGSAAIHAHPLTLAKLSRSAVANAPPSSGRYVPYSAVAGIDLGAFGSREKLSGSGSPLLQRLADNEIVLNEWAAKEIWPAGDRQQQVGQPVALSYFVESDGWLLQEKTEVLRLAGVVALEGAADDRALTPDFPGLRGTSVQDWNPPFPREQWHPEWVRRTDDQYWREYRATPKAFVSPNTAQRLWKSRYGQWTSIRVTPPTPTDMATAESEFRERLRAFLPPETLGLRFQPVKAQGLEAAGSSVSESFGWLFLGFSSFLIVSAAMLVGLLFRLSIERRAKELGLLSAAGFRQRTVRRLLMVEGSVLAVIGCVLGLALAVAYAWLLLTGLKHWWGEALQTSFLQLHVAFREEMFGPLPYPSLTLGFLLSCGVALLTIVWALRALGRMSPRSLLAGQAFAAATGEGRVRCRARWVTVISLTLGLVLALIGGLAAGNLVLAAGNAPLIFFGSGALLLTGGLGFLSLRLRNRGAPWVQGKGTGALLRLGADNTGRNPGRSLLTAGLLASATFLIVAVESFHKTTESDGAGRDSGTGGFPLLAEADVPLYASPDAPMIRRALLPDLGQDELQKLNEDLSPAEIYGFRVRPGDDVSCLNLYQPRQPRLLGVPETFLQRGGFTFGALDKPTEEERQRPWQLLHRGLGNEVPVLADEHTATWVLHLAPGDTWDITDESGQTVRLRLVGLLKGSIFQSELLLSEDNFRKLFPGRGGYSFFLIDAPAAQVGHVKDTLEAALGERFGFTVSRSLDRLAAFHAVENTYLLTFQVLGGLGLLLGTLGLAVVLLRNVWERQAELALLRALGYSRRALGWLVLAENGYLVLLGLAVGTLSALVAVTPHLIERAREIPWLGVLGLLGLVLLFGLSAGGLAVAMTLRMPLLPSLRRE